MEFDISALNNYSLFGLFLVVFLSFIIFVNIKSKKELPGPFGWPIIGNLRQLQKNPARTLTELSNKYGNIFKIKLGLHSVIVLNGHKANKETLNDLSSAFSGRPDSYLFTALYKLGVDFTGPWDEAFKQARKNDIRVLGTIASIRNPNFKQLVEEATDTFLNQLKENYQQQFVNPEKNLIQMMGHVISGVMFGKLSPNPYTDEKYYELLFQMNKYEFDFQSAEMLNAYPILVFFLGWYNFKFKTQAVKFREFFIQQIKKHQTSECENIPNVLDSILQFHKEHSNCISVQNIAGHMTLFFQGGIETVPIFLNWFLIIMGERPDLQDRLANHIRDRIGNEKITFGDAAKLPLLDACIYELHRFATIAPLGFNHALTENTIYKGYHLPKGMQVMSNIWSMHHDSSIWTTPDEFNPDRFIKEHGEEIDPTLTGKVMDFGLGRRRCPGENFARLVTFIFIGTVIQHFKFETDQLLAASLPALDKFGMSRTNPLKIKVTPRFV